MIKLNTTIFNKSNNVLRVCDFKKFFQCIDSEISLTHCIEMSTVYQNILNRNSESAHIVNCIHVNLGFFKQASDDVVVAKLACNHQERLSILNSTQNKSISLSFHCVSGLVVRVSDS